jgi:hypothetical protein
LILHYDSGIGRTFALTVVELNSREFNKDRDDGTGGFWRDIHRADASEHVDDDTLLVGLNHQLESQSIGRGEVDLLHSSESALDGLSCY